MFPWLTFHPHDVTYTENVHFAWIENGILFFQTSLLLLVHVISWPVKVWSYITLKNVPQTLEISLIRNLSKACKCTRIFTLYTRETSYHCHVQTAIDSVCLQEVNSCRSCLFQCMFPLFLLKSRDIACPCPHFWRHWTHQSKAKRCVWK